MLEAAESAVHAADGYHIRACAALHMQDAAEWVPRQAKRAMYMKMVGRLQSAAKHQAWASGSHGCDTRPELQHACTFPMYAGHDHS